MCAKRCGSGKAKRRGWGVVVSWRTKKITEHGTWRRDLLVQLPLEHRVAQRWEGPDVATCWILRVRDGAVPDAKARG